MLVLDKKRDIQAKRGIVGRYVSINNNIIIYIHNSTSINIFMSHLL